jgi:hypothetical protein
MTIAYRSATLYGLTLTIKDWSAISGVKYQLIITRLNKGCPPKLAIFTPVRVKKKFTLYGKYMSLTKWSRISGIPLPRILSRLAIGWSEKQSIFSPLQSHKVDRSDAMLSIYGVNRPISDWAKISGIMPLTIYWRLEHGWPPKLAVFARTDDEAAPMRVKYDRLFAKNIDDLNEPDLRNRPRMFAFRSRRSSEIADLAYHGEFSESWDLFGDQ